MPIPDILECVITGAYDNAGIDVQPSCMSDFMLLFTCITFLFCKHGYKIARISNINFT